MKQQLHPGARWLFRIRGYIGAIFFLWIIGWILFFPLALVFKAGTISPIMVFGNLFVLVIVYIIAVIVLAEIYARMSYNRWFYEFADSNLRIERGIIWKRYSNVPYERVQNVDITRGIIARLCGFSTVNIQTAGYAYSGRGMSRSEGYLPAVTIEGAEKIREFLMKKISKRGRSQGL